MPTLRIQFPEKDSPSNLLLSGNRITIGRRADNTVQIVDRMISAFHAELILEGDHYRLHDLGSTNGTFVNGEQVTDFHLKEGCKIGFGPVDCEFALEAPSQGGESLPTRIEVDAARKENESLQGRLRILEEEAASLRELSSNAAAEGGDDLTRSELQRMIRERAEMQTVVQKHEKDYLALKTELARMNRDRQNLQDALSQAQAELAHLKDTGAAQKDVKTPVSVTSTPVTSATPAAPVKPVVAPVSLPKPSAVAASSPPPAVPVATPRPVVPSAPVAPSAPGVRPVAKPAVAAHAVGAPRAVAAAVPAATPRPGSGPSGTQKITVSTSSATPVPTTPTRPIAKPTGLPKLGSLPKPAAVQNGEGH